MQQLVYRYDGTLDGFLCCVFRAVRSRETPMLILDKDQMQSLLFEETPIETRQEQVRVVSRAIGEKISPEIMDFVRRALLTNLPGREVYLLAFLRRAFREGARVWDDMADPTVCRLRKAVQSLENEAHLYCGFVRFQVSGGVLCATIEPRNRVLSLIMGHFTDRYSGENFLIYDKTHREALISQKGRARILPIEEYSQPPADLKERAFRSLWQRYFKTTQIEQRKNPRCQMTHMPKRYWGQLTEMEGERTPYPRRFPRFLGG